MNDEEFIKIRREIEAMSDDELVAKFNLGELDESQVNRMLFKTADYFFPPRVNPLAKEMVARLLDHSIQNGDSPLETRIAMSIAVPIIAKTFAGGNEATSVDLEIDDLERIGDKIQRLLAYEN